MESLYMLQWVVILFFFTLAIGVIAPIGGIGGGVLFVPLAAAFLPFHVDFIRGAGLIMALTSSLSSSPLFIEKGLANLRIVIPIALVSIVTSICGSLVGLWLTNNFPEGDSYFSICLGILLIFIFIVMLSSKGIEFPHERRIDPFTAKFGLVGEWFEPSLDRTVTYRAANLPYAFLSFAAVGFIAGMFGLGAGWANVPVFNLVMGTPIKVAAATSMLLITVNDAAASWVYIASGAVLPLICVPSVLGMSIGARIGVKLAVKAKPLFIKYLVMAVMLFAAVIDIIKGLRGIGFL
jgi:uncharacterized membrane protein YfcA